VRFGNVVLGVLGAHSREDAMDGVALFARRLSIAGENTVDVWLERFQFRPDALVCLSLWWDGVGQRLPHCAPMHTMLGRQSHDCLSGCVAAPEFLE
jgi:hypothetical protein